MPRVSGAARQGARAEEARLYAQAADLVAFGAWECDLETERLHWTAGVYQMFGVSQDTVLTRRAILPLYDEASRLDLDRVRSTAIATGRPFSVETRLALPNRTTRWLRITGRVETIEGRPTRLFGFKQDITEEQAAWSRLRTLAFSDPLTGLANRRVFEERFRAAAASNELMVLALVDLNDFKLVNDRQGHAAGDECLRQTGRRLRRMFPAPAVAARLGGDEFALLFPHPNRVDLRRRLERAAGALARPIVWGQGAIGISASIGATTLDRHRPAQAFSEADEALYRAKAGDGAVQIFPMSSSGATEDQYR